MAEHPPSRNLPSSQIGTPSVRIFRLDLFLRAGRLLSLCLSALWRVVAIFISPLLNLVTRKRTVTSHQHNNPHSPSLTDTMAAQSSENIPPRDPVPVMEKLDLDVTVTGADADTNGKEDTAAEPIQATSPKEETKDAAKEAEKVVHRGYMSVALDMVCHVSSIYLLHSPASSSDSHMLAKGCWKGTTFPWSLLLSLGLLLSPHTTQRLPPVPREGFRSPRPTLRGVREFVTHKRHSP
jgi:hypothetical protein